MNPGRPVLSRILNGFTLIELMIVVAVIAVIGGGSIVAMVRFTERREALTDALALAEQMRKIQVSASAVDVPSGCTSGVNKYTVNMSGTALTVGVTCANPPGVVSVPEFNFSLKNSVYSTAKTVDFDSRTVAASATDIDICGNGYKYRVSVSSLANVSQPSYQGSCP